MLAPHPNPAFVAEAAKEYAQCIENSKRVRWEIDRDVIRGRNFDFAKSFLPAALSKVDTLSFLKPAEKRFLSQIQGRTYANVFGLVERFIGAKTLEITRDHWFGDQVALEALIRFSDEELKHQELFRRIEKMIAAGMPSGYAFDHDPNAVAGVVLGKSTWSVLGLTLDIEILTQAHFRSSIAPQDDVCPLWKDVFLFHWKEESQHAILDEIEWRREHARLDAAARDRAVDDLIALVAAVDGILQAQAAADAKYFVLRGGRTYSITEAKMVHDTLLKAYRWQYIVSGVAEPRFAKVMAELVTPDQMARVGSALQPIVTHANG